MGSSKVCDAVGRTKGNAIQFADAEKVYVQTTLKGPNDTWVSLPEILRPAWWKGKFVDPVVRLVLALYGHPDAGGYWEAHCNERLVAGGFVPLVDHGWRSTYYHPKLACMLAVYVDDFKLSGPIANLPAAWQGHQDGRPYTPGALSRLQS
jgi:hypothetical protein